MSNAQIEKRLAALEAEVALLKEAKAKGGVPWWKANYGMFANDPMFEEAMKLGREYRESLRPKPKKKRAKGTGDAARQRSR